MKSSTDTTPDQPTTENEIASDEADIVMEPAFTIFIRSIDALAATAIRVDGDTAEDALTKALKHDMKGMNEPVFWWTDRDQMVALDLDRPGSADPVLDSEVTTLFPDSLPKPAAAWVTHDGGLRAVFVKCDGYSALALAGAWYSLAPVGRFASYSVEAKSDSRHPAGARGNERCGRVFTFAPSANFVFPGRPGDAPSEEQVEQWLQENGLHLGRNHTSLCPRCGGKPSDGNPAVVVDDAGVYCHRCKTFSSWGQLVRGERGQNELQVAARALVHLPHQRYVLRHERPNMPEPLFKPAWQFMLQAANADRLAHPDEKIRSRWIAKIDAAGSDRVDVVRAGSGAWLDAVTLEERKVTGDRTMKELPWARSGTMIDAALNSGPLQGFKPISPIPHSALLSPYVPEISGIVVRKPAGPNEPPPVDVGDAPPDPEEVERAWRELRRLFPGLHQGYLTTLIFLTLVAQRQVATPPIVVATGRTGSAKTATASLAAGAVGCQPGDVLLADTGDALRQVGLHLEAGRTPLVFDEVGRVASVYAKLEPVLRLNSYVTFRAKYRNERTIAVTAPIVLAGSTLPHAVVRSPELSRRAVGFRLVDKGVGWDSKGELSQIRLDPEVRSPLDVVTADIWWTVHRLGPNPNWRKYCLEHLGAHHLITLDLDVAGGGRDAVVRNLYEHYRKAPETELTTGTRWAGWLEAGPDKPAAQYLGELVDFEAHLSNQQGEMAELERLDLEEVLGVTEPKLQLLVRKRGRRWLVRFVEVGVMRGRGADRRDLPPAREPDAHGDADTHVAQQKLPGFEEVPARVEEPEELPCVSCATEASNLPKSATRRIRL
jgi:hypothetical protein